MAKKVKDLQANVDTFGGLLVKSITIKDNVYSLKLKGSLKEVSSDMFDEEDEIEKINFKNNITNIKENAFSNLSNLDEVTVPETLESIDNTAFTGCNNVKIINNSSITIDKSKYTDVSEVVNNVLLTGSTGVTTSEITITYSDTTATKTISGNTGTISVSSGDTNVATASVSGSTITVTRTGYGSTSVTVTAAATDTYKSATTTFNVNCNRASIKPSVTCSNLTVGDTTTATVNGNTGNGTITWKSSKDSIASISSTGVVTAIAAGSVRITATIAQSDNYLGATTYKDITINEVTLNTGSTGVSTDSLTITYSNTTATKTISGNTGTISVSSGDTNVATASVSGSTITVTRTGYGSTSITVTAAKSNDYDTATSTFTVNCNKAEQSGTIITNNPEYNSSSNLVKIGTEFNESPTIYYCVGTSLTSSNYKSKGSTTIPTASGMNSGSYVVYYYVEETTNYNEKSGSVNITIPENIEVPDDEIWYTTTDNTALNIVSTDNITALNNMGFVSNTYENEKGIIKFSSSLTELELKAFYGFSNLKTINIPNNVTTINGYVFTSCKSLERITMSNQITYIGSCAFADCTNLNSINSEANSGIINISESTKQLGPCAFKLCENIKYVNIANDSCLLYDEVFYGCTNLTTINIPNISDLNTGLFYNCTSLKSLTIPSSVTTIDNNVFYNCSSLTSINSEENSGIANIPSTVKYLYSGFRGCSSLTQINIPSNIYYYNCYFKDCTNLESVTLPNCERTTSMSSAFQNCEKLSSINSNENSGIINIPNTFRTINSYAFQNCKCITTLNLGSLIESIDSYAFDNTGLTTINFDGSSVEYDFIDISSYSGVPTTYEASKSSSITINCSFVFNLTDDDINTILADEEIPSNQIYYYAPEKITPVDYELSNQMSYYVSEHTYDYNTKKGCITFNKDFNINALSYDSNNKSLFYNTRVYTVKFPSQVTSINSNYFSDCHHLVGMNLSSNVVEIGKNAFKNCKFLKKINSTTNGIINIPNITTIYDNAFSGCVNIVNINCDNLTTLGEEGFRYCTGLTTVSCSSLTSINKNAFRDCTSLSTINSTTTGEVNLPNVTYIGECSFCDCTSIKYIHTNQSSIVSLCDGCFYGLTNLTAFNSTNDSYEINITDNMIYGSVRYWSDKLSGSGTLPIVTTDHQCSLFANCTKIKTATVGECFNTYYDIYNFYHTIEVYGYDWIVTNYSSSFTYLFYGCTNLETATIKCNIADQDFTACFVPFGEDYNLKNIYLYTNKIPDYSGYKNWGYGLSYYDDFSEKNAIEDLSTDTNIYVLPELIDEYKNDVNDYWNRYTNISVIPGLSVTDKSEISETPNNNEILYKTYKGKILNEFKLTHLSNIKSHTYENGIGKITFEDDLTSLPIQAFYGCDDLIHIKLPETLTTIDEFAFSYCHKLMDITIPNSVTNINRYAFFMCDNLSTLNLPSSLTSITDYSFFGCKALTEVEIPDGVTSIGKGTFTSTVHTNWTYETITTMIIPTSVTTISNYAFTSFKNLTIKYRGTEEQWNNISIGTTGNDFSKITFEYNYTD